MYSLSSASQTREPLPRTMKGASPPTAPNARTGEFTPPGIMLAARSCKRRDCSVLRDVVDGIESSRPGEVLEENYQPGHNSNRILYQRTKKLIHQIFILLKPLCNMATVTSGHQVTLLTGRV